MTVTERRVIVQPVELREASDSRTIGGYASVFNRQSENLGGFVEIVARSAFNASAGAGFPDVLARYNHDDNMLLGSTGAGTLRLSVDDTGLSYDVDVPAARADVLELVTRGDVRKSSFAFHTVEDEWGEVEGIPLRTLHSVHLVDVAPVNTPAYPDATAGLRSLATRFDADFEEVREMARTNELSRFFRRTDVLSGARARADIHARRAH